MNRVAGRTVDGPSIDGGVVSLNERLNRAAPQVLAMLSHLGRRIYFPAGTVSQGVEAKQMAEPRFNATVGLATEGGAPMYLPAMHQQVPHLAPSDVFPYAPTAGKRALRAAWREKLLRHNPSLKGLPWGDPIVTGALTHGLSLAADLCVDPGDPVLVPDQIWGNLLSILGLRCGGRIVSYPLLSGGGLDVGGFRLSVESTAKDEDKIVVVLNFPNNPTGYTPTVREAQQVADVLAGVAQSGTKVVTICDDAYFGLFFHLNGRTMTESIFSLLVGRHPNLLCFKVDGATKELFAWGLRCGFLTVGLGAEERSAEILEALEEKISALIRTSVSNVSHPSQTLIQKTLENPSWEQEQRKKVEVLRDRAVRAWRAATRPEYSASWEVVPFNSGYFMVIRLRTVDAEHLRGHLLSKYRVGLVSTSAKELRVAFSSVEADAIEPLFANIHSGIIDLAVS